MTATDKLGIVERLTRTTKFRVRDGGPIHEAFRNPDGLEAAALIEELVGALDALNCSDILGVAESCASGTPRWDHVNRKITATRALLAKVRPQ